MIQIWSGIVWLMTDGCALMCILNALLFLAWYHLFISDGYPDLPEVILVYMGAVVIGAINLLLALLWTGIPFILVLGWIFLFAILIASNIRRSLASRR